MSDDDRREWEASVDVRFQTTEEDVWKCLTRSGIVAGHLIGETMIQYVEVREAE